VVNYEDRRRLSLYKKLGKVDYDSPSLYHMVLNMSRMDLDKGCALICELLKS
jgi:cytidylate kinase